MMKINEIDNPQWSLDTLNKAYRQGYLFGLSGESKSHCPYRSDVVAAAWEAGWSDGDEQAVQLQSRNNTPLAAIA